MNSEELRNLIDVVINYIPMIYPGIISVSVFNFCNAESAKDIKLFFIKAVSVGYIYNIFLKEAQIDKYGNVFWYNTILIVLSIVAPMILYKLIHSPWMNRVLDFFKIYTSVIDNDYDEMCSGEDYNYLRIYSKDKTTIYEGFVRTYEKDSDRRRYIILNNYKIIHIGEENNEIVIRDFSSSKDENDKIIIYQEDIGFMEKLSMDFVKK